MGDQHDELDAASGAWRKPAPVDDDPTVEVDLGKGRTARFTLPHLAPGWWALISLLGTGTGTGIGGLAATLLAQDWLGLEARAEVQALHIQILEQRHAYELAAVRCGCPVAAPAPLVAP